ncbi:MAG: acetyl-CoA carboxylase biotin carboxyl carrier protein subunit [Syntrophomonadaceae bacterium]
MANLESPLAGKIFEINIEVGQAVNEDDEVIVIDAMKMENPVYCPVTGTVKEIKVKIGDQVNEGDVLAVIEE